MRLRLATTVLLLAGFAVSAKADNFVTNGNFSPANPGTGYGAVTGWVETGLAGSNSSGQPFWDNGTLPVAGDLTVGFLQGNSTFSQTLNGLTVNGVYTLSFYENARTCCDANPTLTVLLGGSTLLGPSLITPVGGSNPFIFVTDTFVATASSEVLEFSSDTGGHDGTSLLSDVVVSSTPEPSSLMLLGTGILGAAGMMRRRLVRS